MGALSKHIHHWEKIDTPEYLKSWINEGVSIPFAQIPEPCAFGNPNCSEDEENFIDSKLTKLLNKSFISKVNHQPHCVTPIRCTPKKNSIDKYRLINNMRHVNQFINVPKMRYEDLSHLPNIMRKYDLFASIDLKDGFHHIKIKKEFRTYFGWWLHHLSICNSENIKSKVP